jgi:hypothetical protein
MRTVTLHGNTLHGALAQVPVSSTGKIDKQAEVAFVRELLSSCWSQLSSYDRIDFAKQGFDIVIAGRGRSINIELKASSIKADYFNQNGAKANLHGNCLKAKDLDLRTGLLKADFLVFAAQMTAGFDFWLFTRDDLATLFPRSPTFIPSFVPTLMIEAPAFGLPFGSHFNDDFNLFKKGVICIILPSFDENSSKWLPAFPTGHFHSFLDTWCPLYDQEYRELSKVVLAKLASRFNPSSIFSHSNKANINPNFRTRLCSYRNNNSDPKCQRCRTLIGSITNL